MDNFQAIIMGRPVEADLVDDGWTHHYAAVQHPPRTEGMTIDEYMRSAEAFDYSIMEAASAPGRGAGGRPGHR